VIIKSLGSVSEPIFVIGMNGSGTTLLADCLGQHSGIYSFVHESKVLPYIIDNLHKYGDLSQDAAFSDLWNDLVKIPAVSIQLANDLRKPDGWREWPRTLAGAIDGLFRYLGSMDGLEKNRWCEKTPMHALHINKLSRVFPRAKFIHLIRDGRDCAASFHRRWRRSPELTIYQWRQLIKQAREQSKIAPQNYLEIKFEDFTDKPEEIMKFICGWLLIEYEPALLKVKNHGNKNFNFLKIEKNSRNWSFYFNEAKISLLEQISGASLKENGYEVSIICDHDPAKWRRNMWLLTDYIRQLVSETKEQIFGHPYRTWPMYFRYLTDAYRQVRSKREM